MAIYDFTGNTYGTATSKELFLDYFATP